MGKRLPKENKVRHSIATYRMPGRNNNVCDLDELAEHLGKVFNVPERVGFVKANEIAMMARYFTIFRRANKQLRAALKRSTLDKKED